MLGSGFKAEHLRVNLRLVINQLAQKARKEIADYLAAGKDERARIRVEHIIREDYFVEAMEILELYCDLLLARFGLIQSMKELDSGLAESVSTLIWALKIVADQLCAKYSKTNQIGTVNDRLMHNLSVEAPSKILVERYLIEIAKNYNVPYEPDSVVMAEAPSGVETDLIDFSVDPETNNRRLRLEQLAPGSCACPFSVRVIPGFLLARPMVPPQEHKRMGKHYGETTKDGWTVGESTS
uniref:IST1 homolog n=1 Tax=Pan paniscus TaxID=9597 RepID=A0A2R9B7B1_PANPA